MSTPQHLLPHAILDLPSRYDKALKIERLLELSNRFDQFALLEIGTGSGGIAHYFATHANLRCDVTAVDVLDQRQVKEGYRFVQVGDTELPFADASFEVVLSNHVIEHVGDEKQQLAHLRELRRVLKPNGLGYLAVPNRWMLVEPHYRLAFLSWLPKSCRTPYLRLMHRGRHYDCNPLTLFSVKRLLAESGLRFEYLGTRALHEILAIEGEKGLFAALAAALPDPLLDHLAAINPTLIYRLEHESDKNSQR